jgi:hypothetical protein
MSKDCIFLETSFPLEKAKAIHPEALYYRSIQCGDLTQLLLQEEKPKRVAIIDGSFEQTAAVWHKEILHLLDHGIPVLGASSLGALRAAELDSLGMIGMGEIYQAFASGKLNDDDEVAVSFSKQQGNIVPLSIAMVDIRHNLRNMLTQQIISQTLHDKLITTGKQLFYKERSWVNILKDCPPSEVAVINSWLSSNETSLKALDAEKLIQHLATTSTPKPKAIKRCQHSLLFEELIDSTEQSLFLFSQAELCEKQPQLAQLLALTNKHQKAIRQENTSKKLTKDIKDSIKALRRLLAISDGFEKELQQIALTIEFIKKNSNSEFLRPSAAYQKNTISLLRANLSSTLNEENLLKTAEIYHFCEQILNDSGEKFLNLSNN